MLLPHIETAADGSPIYTANITTYLYALADLQYNRARKKPLPLHERNATRHACQAPFWTGTRVEPVKIVDIIPFAFEVDILEIRMHELNDVVDTFVVYEGSHTQQGIPKPFVFERYSARFKPFAHKIVHIRQEGDDARLVTPTLFKDTHKWINENTRQHAYRDYVRRYRPDASTLFVSADVDEIPPPSAIDAFRHCTTRHLPCAFYCSMFEVDAETIRVTRDGKGYWTQPTILEQGGPLRHSRANMYPIEWGVGAHFHVRDPYAFVAKLLGTAEAGRLDADIRDPTAYFKSTRACKHAKGKGGRAKSRLSSRIIWTPETAIRYRSEFKYMWPSTFPEWRCHRRI